MNPTQIIATAKRLDASDVHFICGLRPMLRIHRDLVEDTEENVLTKQDLWDVYDFFLNGNIDKDNFFKENRILDTSAQIGTLRLRVNVSYSDGIPVITSRLIKDTLPSFESLGLPDIVRRMTFQSQGLILVTGKTNSGKSTTLNSLVDYINTTQNKKVLTLESPIEYKHFSKKSIIIQKEVGPGGDMPSYELGTKNSLREDCDILEIGEIRDKITLEAAIESAESGHLVIGTLHTKSCAETLDRMLNFYDVRDQMSIKFLLASLLKLVVSQRLIKNKVGTLSLVPEIMVVNNVVAGTIRKEKLNASEVEDAIQSSSSIGSVGLVNSLAELVAKDELSIEVAQTQIEEKNYDFLNKMIQQTKIKMIANSGNM